MRLAAVLVVSATLVGVAGAASKPTRLPFTTVIREEQPVAAEPYWNPLRVGGIQGVVFATAAEPENYDFLFSKSTLARIDAVNFNTHFVFAAWTKQRTTGYTLTIKRVLFQRASATKRQLCLIATLAKPRPGAAVIARPTYAEHVVAISSRTFGPLARAIPRDFVLRGTSGALLATSRKGGTLNNEMISSTPKLCRADLRISAEDSTVR